MYELVWGEPVTFVKRGCVRRKHPLYDSGAYGTSFWLRATLFLMRLSNIADLPSRGKYELLERLGARGVYYVPLVGTTDWNAPLTNWIERGARDE